MSEKELLKQALNILKELKEHGDFYCSAIELNPWSNDFDGETFEKRIDKLLKDSDKWQHSNG